MEIFLTLVDGRKLLSNVTKSTIPDSQMMGGSWKDLDLSGI